MYHFIELFSDNAAQKEMDSCLSQRNEVNMKLSEPKFELDLFGVDSRYATSPLRIHSSLSLSVCLSEATLCHNSRLTLQVFHQAMALIDTIIWFSRQTREHKFSSILTLPFLIMSILHEQLSVIQLIWRTGMTTPEQMPLNSDKSDFNK